MFGGNIFILKPVGVFLGGEEHIVSRPIHSQLRAGGAGQAIELGFDRLLNGADVGPQLLKQADKRRLLFPSAGR